MKTLALILVVTSALAGCKRSDEPQAANCPPPVVIKVLTPDGMPVTNAIVYPSDQKGTISILGAVGDRFITDKNGIVRAEEYRACPVIGIAFAQGYQSTVIKHKDIDADKTNIVVLTPERQAMHK